MSRSKRKPIYKDKGWEHDNYNKAIRRVQKQKIKDIINLRDVETYNIPLGREIVNDYNVCDFVIDLRYENNKKDKFYFKLLRK